MTADEGFSPSARCGNTANLTDLKKPDDYFKSSTLLRHRSKFCFRGPGNICAPGWKSKVICGSGI